MRGSCEWDRGSAVWTTPGFSHARLPRSSHASRRADERVAPRGCGPAREREPRKVAGEGRPWYDVGRTMGARFARIDATPTEHADKTAASRSHASGPPPRADPRRQCADIGWSGRLRRRTARSWGRCKRRRAPGAAPGDRAGWNRPRAGRAGGARMPARRRALDHTRRHALPRRRLRRGHSLPPPARRFAGLARRSRRPGGGAVDRAEAPRSRGHTDA
jgi:hypothetical protein